MCPNKNLEGNSLLMTFSRKFLEGNTAGRCGGSAESVTAPEPSSDLRCCDPLPIINIFRKFTSAARALIKLNRLTV